MRYKMIFDGEIKDDILENITADSPAFCWGMGVFETLLYENNRIYFLTEHLNRMKTSCSELNLPYPVPNNIKEEKIMMLIRENGLTDSSARIRIIHSPLYDDKKWNTVVTAVKYERNTSFAGVSLCPVKRENTFYSYKTISYMQNILIKKAYPDFDEVLLINTKGNVIEGTYTNIIAVKDNIVYYVSGDQNCLPGIMQSKIISDHKKLGFSGAEEVKEGFSRDFLSSARELILTNSLMIARNIDIIDFGNRNLHKSYNRTAGGIREFYLKVN